MTWHAEQEPKHFILFGKIKYVVFNFTVQGADNDTDIHGFLLYLINLLLDLGEIDSA
jgi:hypothetical protein